MTNDQNVPIHHGSSTGSRLGLSDDDLYRVLASTLRRRLLYVLLDGEERSIDEIATVLTGWDAAEVDTINGSDACKRIRLELQHTHLPLLSEAGLIDWDRQQSTVTFQNVALDVEELLQRSIQTEPATQ